jgi:hypothetical protein
MREGAKKWFIEIIKGADWSTRVQRYMQKLRVIERRRIFMKRMCLILNLEESFTIERNL